MSYNFTPLIQAAITAGTGAAVAFFLHRISPRRSAKNEFGVFVRQKIGQLPQRGVDVFYRTTKPDIRSAVDRVWHFMKPEHRRTLDRLWAEYDQIPAHEFDSKHEGAMGEVARKLYRIAGTEFQTPYEIVRFYLDEFYKLSA